MDERHAREEKKRTRRMLENQTYSDPLVFVIDFYIIPFPGDGGLRMTTWGNALHYGRLSCSYNHIARGLSEIVPQNCKTERGMELERVKEGNIKFNSGVNIKIKTKGNCLKIK